MKIIFTINFEINCYKCDACMTYHSYYWVNYKSNNINTQIVIIRLKCYGCNETHAIKPHFLASRHQYDTFEREKYVLEYNQIVPEKYSLRQLQIKLFFNSQVSHTVMYYWVKLMMAKEEVIVPDIISGIQELDPSRDVVNEFLDQASEIPEDTRDKPYSRAVFKIINWAKIYVQQLQIKTQIRVNLYNFNNPYININKILDILTAHVFL